MQLFNATMPLTEQTSIKNWENTWQSTDYKKKLILGLILISIILTSLPFFFQAIETRNGILINDYILREIPSYDMSLYIFTIIWGMALLTFSRFKTDPQLFLTFLWGYILINLTRFISIGLFPLSAPIGLIDIHDPISNAFYGPKRVTKDLFYSGHTAAMFLMFLCLNKKLDKILALLSTIAIAVLLLIQHVHYTADVLFAPVITYLIWLASKKIVASKNI